MITRTHSSLHFTLHKTAPNSTQAASSGAVLLVVAKQMLRRLMHRGRVDQHDAFNGVGGRQGAARRRRGDVVQHERNGDDIEHHVVWHGHEDGLQLLRHRE